MSHYTALELYLDDNDGTLRPVPDAIVEVRDVTDDPVCVRLADTASDANGTVPSGSVPTVAAGRTLRFTWKDENNGRCGSALKTTV